MFLTNEKKSTLIQIVNYGKTTFDKNKKIEKHDMTSVDLKQKLSNILRSKKLTV